MKIKYQIILGCCTVFFCMHSAFAQDTTSCTYLRQWRHASAQTKDLAQEVYDSVRFYIKHCAANDSEAFISFTHLDGAVSLLYTYQDSSLYPTYRDWLISVLFLNKTDPRYFCSCMSSIMGTYGNRAAGDKYNLPNGGLAVMNYLRGLSQCNIGGDIDSMYARNIRYRHQEWLDGDRKTPEDTTLPSLDQLGLGFLLKNSVTPKPISPIPSQYLASFTSSPNPFNKETTLQFTLNRMTYTTIAVYDELGRLVWVDGRGSSLEAGEHTIHLDATNFPSGTLYARILTGFGEVKTVKLIHEK